MDALLFDLRYAIRRLRQARAFTLVVVLTLALGIGANSAIFSVVNTVLLRPLPYAAPDRLVTIYHYYPSLKLEASVSAPGFKDYRDRTHDFVDVAVQNPWQVNLTGVGEPERLRGQKVSAQFFSALGIAPLFGRVPRPDEDAIGHNHVVVLSYGLWKRLFGGDSSAVGKQASLNGETYDIVGVMPASFVDPWNRYAEIWTPLALDPKLFVPSNYTNEFLNLTALLKPGVTVAQAKRDMAAFAEQLKKENPTQFPPRWTLELKPMSEVRTGSIRPALLVLLGAVGFVLLIACANVANLMLSRAAARQKEVAIRTALGANRWVLVRQLLVESVVLSLTGGALGLLLAYAGVRALVAVNPSNIPRIAELSIDGRVVAFTAVVAVITGLLFGVVPAIQSSRGGLHAALKEGGRGGTTDRGGQFVRRALVVAEVALALALLVGGGLLLKSFARLEGVDPGFSSHNLLTFNLALPKTQYPNDTVQAAFFAAVLPRIAAVPGVKAAGATSVMPFGGNWSTGSFNVEGYTPPPKGSGPWGDIRIVTPSFFSTLQIPLIKGRYFGPQDDAQSPTEAVVDEEFVHKFYTASQDPIGRRLYFGPNPPNSKTQYITIVGVVGHAMHEGLDADPRVQVYFPEAQVFRIGSVPSLDIAVRTSGDPRNFVSAVRNAIHDVDRNLPMSSVSTMDDLINASLGERRLSAVLLGVFSAIALMLASIGIYGVMSYTVAQRTREMGVRVALGAPRGRVLRLILGQGMTLALLGVGLGLVGAFGLTRFIAAQLYQVRPTDPITFATVAAILSVVALAAMLGPAMRATRVDPIVALREE
ncbi:MAG TPA: ABC transporter permease [Gemmatimonadaceae bacterium]